MAVNYRRLEDISRGIKLCHNTGKCFHVTFAYDGNKLLAIGRNNYEKSHLSHKYGEYISRKGTGNYRAAIHGELSAILKLGMENCSHITFINVRIDNNGNPAKSKPCVNCQRILNAVKYKAIIYHDGEKYVKEKHKL